MRWAITLGICMLWSAAIFGQDVKPPTRHGVIAIYSKYPQGTAKEALASVVKALENRDFDYVLAHLTDPAFVDRRVKEYGGKFDELVAEARAKFASNPAALKQLRRFLKEGEWEEMEDTVTVKLKDAKDQQVFLKRIGKRWYLENRMQPKPERK